jgi:MerR family transcriptional regulator, light-induced transcriptional regulator
LLQREIRDYTSRYLKLVLNRDRGAALSFVSEIAGTKNYTLLDVFDVLTASQQKVGELWAKGAITVADEHFASETTLDSIELVSEKMKRFRRSKKGTALVANLIEGEFHTISLKMFSELLRSEGWEVDFYSSSLSVAQVFKYLEKTGKKFDLICISLTMKFNLAELQSILKILRTNILTRGSKLVIGSQLFKAKRNRNLLVDNETGLPLADYVALDFAGALSFINQSVS